MKLHKLQDKFKLFVLTGEADKLARHVKRTDRHADERLMIHFNNSRITLIDALADNFPVLCRLVGQSFFHQLAASYVKEHLPVTPVLAEYGHTLPEFIGGRRELENYGYLVDIARLELAWNRAIHSRDATPIDQEDLAVVNLEQPEGLVFHFLPSLELVSSNFPLLKIWQDNQQDEDPRDNINLDEGPDHIILCRPQWQVTAFSVERNIFEFTNVLRRGNSLGDALLKVTDQQTGFDLSRALAFIFSNGLVTQVTDGKDIS
ncbi:DNA-binding domain-containing protein [Emcibacter sp.]|uniref:HvfC/BufC N-terminal domain-containing protein n=1 Tax=Emcibacter sp. TaxID=1979954 RepID=UPI002AA6C28E|nr:DNA-binding domain-containing protein [Emcibacter sp.]